MTKLEKSFYSALRTLGAILLIYCGSKFFIKCSAFYSTGHDEITFFLLLGGIYFMLWGIYEFSPIFFTALKVLIFPYSSPNNKKEDMHKIGELRQKYLW